MNIKKETRKLVKDRTRELKDIDSLVWIKLLESKIQIFSQKNTTLRLHFNLRNCLPFY